MLTPFHCFIWLNLQKCWCDAEWSSLSTSCKVIYWCSLLCCCSAQNWTWTLWNPTYKDWIASKVHFTGHLYGLMQATLGSGTEPLTNPHIDKQAFPYRKFLSHQQEVIISEPQKHFLPINSSGIVIFITGGSLSSQIVLHLFFCFWLPRASFSFLFFL